MIEDIRVQPRLARRTTPALIDQSPWRAAEFLSNEPASFLKLHDIVGITSHAERDTVCSESKPCACPALRRDLCERSADAVDICRDKAGMIEELAQQSRLRCLRPNLGLGACDVFAILAAARIGAVCRGQEDERVT